MTQIIPLDIYAPKTIKVTLLKKMKFDHIKMMKIYHNKLNPTCKLYVLLNHNLTINNR